MGNMTTGQIIGTVAGAVIGYFTGGAGWYLVGSVMIGAGAGYAAGSAIDPNMPDMPSPGQSTTGNLDITTANEGIVIADALGTVKSVGNIFWYGNSRVKEIYTKVKGGKGGGSKKQKTGEEYYLTWAIGICLGPVDELISIFSGDNPIWQGNASINDSVDGYTLITTDSGDIYFYFGNTSSVIPSSMAEIINDETGQTYYPPYKNLCWAYFDDYKLGNYNRAPTIKFVYRKSPSYAWNIQNRIGGFDYNPAHAIYYLITSATELPTSIIDEDSFSTVADTLLAENRGISVLFGEERNALAFLENIITHINGILQFQNDGKFHLALIRDDLAKEDMPSFSEVDLIEPPSITRRTWEDTYNDVRVQYAKRVDVEFESVVDTVKNPDVYVMGFIDESFTTVCSSDWSDYESNTYSRGYCLCTSPVNVLNCGTPCPKLLYDLEQYYLEDEITPKPKTWLMPGSYHVTNINRMLSPTWGYWTPLLPNGYNVNTYTDIYEDGLLTLWSTDLALWQARFRQMIALGRGEFIPGSILRVYIDTSSMGGIAALEPAYSLFKVWVLLNYGGLVYQEYEHIGEWWIQMLHEDLTPWGYGGGS